MAFLDKHWNVFLKSFKIDKLALKLFFTDILFVFTTLILSSILYAFWLKTMWSMYPLFNITDGDSLVSSNIDISALWDGFVINVLLMILAGIVLYIILISLYSALSHTFINNKRLSWRLFLNFLGIYAIITTIYLLLIAIFFNISKDVVLIAWLIILLTLLYMYFLLIFYLVISDGKWSNIWKHGLKSIIRLHDTMIPLIIGLILMTLSTLILNIIFNGITWLVSLLAFIIFLYLATWLKKYLHHIIHESYKP